MAELLRNIEPSACRPSPPVAASDRAGALSWWPALIAVGLLLFLYLPLLRPSRVLAVRDVPFFHLPLRSVLVGLARSGQLPEWNPLIHGGQPILSNPNYAAFYPPTWLSLLLPVGFSLGVLVALHGGWAAFGSWRLLRRLGISREAAALGVMGYAAGSCFLSLSWTFNFYCALAWLPWVLLGWRAASAPGAGWAPVVGTGLALALQLLAGEPVAVLISGILLAALTVQQGGRRRTGPRLLAVALLAAMLGAVQLIPSWSRLEDTVRGGGLPAGQAGAWSSPPARLAELFFPHLWGDPTRTEENLFFTWGVFDFKFPYVLALYPGLLLAVIGTSALLRWPIPGRWGWALAGGGGYLLALGRHNPLFSSLTTLPVLRMVRFPEKFAVLAFVALVFAGALGWHHLLERRQEGRPEVTDFPLALAAVLALLATVVATVLMLRPEVGAWLVRSHSWLPPTPEQAIRGVAYLRLQAWIAVAATGGVVALLSALRWTRLPSRGIALLAGLLLALDLGFYGHRLNPTLPAERTLAPPPLAETALRLGGRVFTATPLGEDPEVGIPYGPRGFYSMLGRIRRLDPYSGNLWSLAYALDEDYDLMLTGWGRFAHRLLVDHWNRQDRGGVAAILGGWDVGVVIFPRSSVGILRELYATGRLAEPARLERNLHRLPRYRFVRRVEAAADRKAAFERAPRLLLDLATNELCVGARYPAGGRTFSPGRVFEAEERGGHLRLHYKAAGPAFLVAAHTFDRGWRAVLPDLGRAVTPCPTALGQIGLELPGGEHRVELTFHDRTVDLGAALSASTILLLGLAWVVTHRRGGSSGVPPR